MDWRKALAPPTATIEDAIRAIDESVTQICLVVDQENRLLGTVTDGDIRRAILNGRPMETPVSEIMNRKPHTAPESVSKKKLLDRIVHEFVRQIPLLDEEQRVTGLACIDDLLAPEEARPNVVVLMAGGQGSRLRPITESTPKPLLSIGNKPLLETILEGFIEENFERFYISVNYKAEIIKSHFGNGKKWGVDIRYIHEDRPLGTAGALSLLPERPTTPIIVMNGDLLTQVNFQHMLDFHHQHKARATICVRKYDFKVPFGVVHIENNRMMRIDEKPVHSFFINAGIYVLEPDVIDLIPDGGHFDMPSLFERVIDSGDFTAAFPIREYWIDVGTVEDFDLANREYPETFG